MRKTNTRLRHIDFLRDVAIVLVLFRHQSVSYYLKNMGWIGVDLFFVLSGFLVSGLLYKEFFKHGSISPIRFLIRRGFKIYPLYYLSYCIYLIPLIYLNKLEPWKVFYDLIYIQNYMTGWGYAYSASWSLAVEEHFYIGLVIFLWLGIKKYFVMVRDENKKVLIENFEYYIIFSLVLCLIMRFGHNLYFPDQFAKNFTMTHLRIDSLLFGVLISYYYYFKNYKIDFFFKNNAHRLFIIFIIGLSWTPFIEPLHSFFAKTIGFTLVYLSFGCLLTIFLFCKNINSILNSIFSTLIVDSISKIGYCSYSIYLIHSIVNDLEQGFVKDFFSYNSFVTFLLTTILSIGLGIMMTYKIEKYILLIRNKNFPSNC